MDIRQIKYFIQICADKSFSKAAENLHISQQGLSKIINNLEDELGIPLFYRSSRGVNPTEFGSLLLEKSRKVISEFDLLVDFVNSKTNTKKGTMSIGLPPILHTNNLAYFICDFHKKYPYVQLEIVELGPSECERKLSQNLLDICFTIKPMDIENFNFIPVFSCDMILLINKENPLSKSNSLWLEDLQNENFVMLTSEYKSQQIILEYCLQLGFKPNIVFTTSLLDLIAELVAVNRGIAILPDLFSLKGSKINNKVSITTIRDAPLKVDFGFVTNKGQRQDYMTDIIINYTMDLLKYKNI